ncbi:hypothetical protein [Pseudarthrobacter sp. S9]|uniref:hypothetical protein n=1 Tax=Pseudarthrobacter sp. S9 TaxID=3418421 RepID=UPI003D03D5A8
MSGFEEFANLAHQAVRGAGGLPGVFTQDPKDGVDNALIGLSGNRYLADESLVDQSEDTLLFVGPAHSLQLAEAYVIAQFVEFSVFCQLTLAKRAEPHVIAAVGDLLRGSVAGYAVEDLGDVAFPPSGCFLNVGR